MNGLQRFGYWLAARIDCLAGNSLDMVIMVVEYGSEGGSSNFSAGAGEPSGPDEATRATYSISLPGRPAIFLPAVTEREANEIAMNVRLREILRKRKSQIERLEAELQCCDGERDRMMARIRLLEKERDGLKGRMAIDVKSNSKTKEEKVFFFIFMSSYAVMSFLK
jgi:hypothetical protein